MDFTNARIIRRNACREAADGHDRLMHILELTKGS